MRLHYIAPELAKVLRPSALGFILGTVCAVASGLTMLLGLWCLVKLTTNFDLLWIVCALVLWVMAAVLIACSAWFSHTAEARFSTRIKREVAQHLVRLPSSTIARYSGDSLKRLVSDDIAALHHLLAHLPSEIATFVVVPLLSIVFLVSYVGAAAIWILLPGICAALCYLWIIPKLMARHAQNQANIMSDITVAIDDYARGIQVNRIYGTESGALAVFYQAAQRFVDSMISRVSRVASIAAIATGLLQAVATFAVAYSVTYNQPLNEIAAALLFSLAIVTPALKLGHGLDYVTQGIAAAKRLVSVLQERKLAYGTQVVSIKSVPLTLENIELTRQNQTINGCFLPATITAITGVSGVGKSTLLRVLAGFENAQQGSVKIGQIDVKALTEETRRNAFLLISQGADVLAATVRENLALSMPSAMDEQFLAALEKAQLSVDLNADAALLSGGERQRLSLARVFLSSAPFILLDEPTSALDQATAQALFKELQRFTHSFGRTLIFVTHDLRLAEQADTQLQISAKNLEKAVA